MSKYQVIIDVNEKLDEVEMNNLALSMEYDSTLCKKFVTISQKLTEEWININNKKPPLEKGILVTDGEQIINCKIIKSGGKFYLHGHNFDGYEWDWQAIHRYENIKKWMPLPKA